MTAYFFGSDAVVSGTAVTMASGDTLFIASGVNVGSTGASAAVILTGAFVGTTVCGVNGTLLALAGDAFQSTMGSVDFTVGAAGTVFASGDALVLGGQSNRLTNNGEISSGADGVQLTDASNSVINNGSISGETGIRSTAVDGNDFLNTGTIAAHATGMTLAGTNHVTNSGTIHGQSLAIEVTGTTGNSCTIENSGIISTAGEVAIACGDGHNAVINGGHIVGAIEFGIQSDSYDGDVGTITSYISGGDGDDFLIAGAGKNTLFGGDGVDTLEGGDGRDSLSGSLGSDTLDGGDGRDVFLYSISRESGGEALDTIVGFDFRKDVFGFEDAISGIDATVTTGMLRSGGNFVSDLAAAIGAAQLAVEHAVLFTPTSGNYAGHTILVCENGGGAGFQKNKDFVFDLSDADNLGSLDTGDFV